MDRLTFRPKQQLPSKKWWNAFSFPFEAYVFASFQNSTLLLVSGGTAHKVCYMSHLALQKKRLMIMIPGAKWQQIMSAKILPSQVAAKSLANSSPFCSNPILIVGLLERYATTFHLCQGKFHKNTHKNTPSH